MTGRTVTHATFCIERTYPAAPQRVFAAFADAEAKRRWFVEGEGFTTLHYHPDFRVGGHERSGFAMEGMGEFFNETRYDDIVENRRIIFTYTMARGDSVFSVSLATVELEPVDGGTRLTFTEQGAFLEGADGPEMRKAGWGQLLQALEKELAREAVAA